VSRNDRNEDDVIRKEILAYLEAHPQSADTAEGIRDWWIGSKEYHTTVERVRRVLDRLVREGHVRRVKITGGSEVYRAGVKAGPT
jgi:Fe2+ or Zn2+ uptake regulation protein